MDIFERDTLLCRLSGDESKEAALALGIEKLTERGLSPDTPIQAEWSSIADRWAVFVPKGAKRVQVS